MKKLAIALSLSVGLGALVAGGPVQAGEDEDKLKDNTCAQYLALDEAKQDDIV